MTNPTQPYGFSNLALIDGSDASFGIITRPLSSTNTHSIYRGDPAVFSAGYYDVASATGATGAGVAGIFEEFTWPSISAGMTVRTRAWLGNTADIVAGGTLSAKIAIHPQLVMQAKVTGGVTGTSNPITQAMVGQFCNFGQVTGPGNNLVSTFSVDAGTVTGTGGVTATLPFKIHGLVQPPNSDPTSYDNDVYLIFNPASFNQT
jgi:hypothetical protein